ncbi:vacuolar protein sorting-associated protein 26-like isoform X2 [Hylaeus volcanicus]|uniref:vacuolar protein sorting-associated protein 26-like isoform X2 n=1 Tax=Hylaeus volcanicus TaxID=313075 RepID=UPI0023B8685E|nr:vacuolar protein sorting-associated protein 26-like isoform X2 [Hylaeus volcanicus]
MLSAIFSSGCTIDLILDRENNRQCGIVNALEKRQEKRKTALIFNNYEDVSGTAVINISPARKLEHYGIRVELIGQLNTNVPYCFFAIFKDLDSPGCLYESKTYHWKLQGVEKEYETYWGVNVSVRYFVRLCVVQKYGSTLMKEVDLIVQNPVQIVPESEKVKMEFVLQKVGIEGCLHIEFEYDKLYYHLKDVVRGKINFLLVRIKLKYMEIHIVKTETVKGSYQQYTTTDIIGKFEVMDGSPLKLECIPVRLYLCCYDLTPTYNNIQNRYSVKYYLNIVLVDEEERRYFKRHDITLYRKEIT